jgi:hypothetical protein
MTRLMKRLTGPVISTLLAGIIATTLPTAPARADDYWRESKRYTAAIKQAAVDAAQKLKDAKQVLDDAKEALEGLQAAIAAGEILAEGTAAAEALAAAGAAVAEATAAVAAAAEVLAVATAVVAAFMAGTLAGEGLGYLISFCWDPICYYDSNNLYSWPDSDDVDLWIPLMLHNGAGVDMTRADFDRADAASPGTGTASWNYLRETARCFAISARGAADFTANHYASMPAATSNLNASLARYCNAVNQFAPRLPGMMTYSGNPRLSLQNAQNALNNVQAQITHFTDQAYIQNVIDQSRAALNQAAHGLDLASDPAGNPRPIDGPTGVLDPLSLSEFLQFLNDCANQGAAASPPAEILTVDGLMTQLGIAPRGQPSMGPAIASWDGAGDRTGESSLFPGGADLPLSQVLLSSVPFNWQQINLDTSPLVYLSIPAATSFEPPQYTGNGAGIPLNVNGWQNLGTGGAMNVYAYPGNNLLIPGNPAGAGTQFAGCAFPITGTVMVQRPEPTMHGITTLWDDFIVRRPVNVNPGTVMVDIELVSLSLSSVAGSQQLFYSGGNPNGFDYRFNVFNASGTQLPPQTAPASMPLQFGRWYRSMITVNLDTNQITQVGMIDLTTNALTRTAPSQPWYLRGGAGSHQPVNAVRYLVNAAQGGAFAFDNYSPYAKDRCVTNNWVLLDDIRDAGTASVFTALPNAAGPLTFQWRHNGVNLADDGRITGAHTSTLEIYPCWEGDSGAYDVVISNACNSLASNAATLTVRRVCGSVDFNCDGDLGTDADIEAFFACLAGNCPQFPCNNTADFNADGDLGTDADIESFFSVLAGGPC